MLPLEVFVGTGDFAPYLILFIMVVLVSFFKERILPGSGKQEGTQLGAEIHSPAVPIIIYANPIDQFLVEHYPNAR